MQVPWVGGVGGVEGTQRGAGCIYVCGFLFLWGGGGEAGRHGGC